MNEATLLNSQPPLFAPTFPNPFPQSLIQGLQLFHKQQEQAPVQPELQLKRALNFLADNSGCGMYRISWASHLLNAHQKMISHDSTVMCFDPNYYRGISSVRVQRQATPHQLKFVQFLKEVGNQLGFRVIFEIDDIMFGEDIPNYNKFRPAFTSPEIRKTAQEIMNTCDEITCTCDFMKDYYASKTGHKNITVIPNYVPKFWMGHFYDEKRIEENYEKSIRKPRILYAGSGAHFDVDNRTGQKDDFFHVCEVIAKTRDKFQWVFLGAYPLPLHQLIQSGQLEYHPWELFYNYPEKIYDLRVNMMIAPLQDNTFNKAKSDLKYLESCCYGLPIACQDLVTYKDAPIKFKTGDEMIDQITETLSRKGRYMNFSARARRVAEKRWLENEDNLNKYVELYTLPWGHPDRKLINSINSL